MLLFSFKDGVNIGFGVLFGFLMCLFLTLIIMSVKVKKHNKNEVIRDISTLNYDKYFKKKDESIKTKDKVINALIDEVSLIAKNESPDSTFPLLELSLNDILDAIDHIQNELSLLIEKPVIRSFKNRSIKSLKDEYLLIMKIYIPITNNSAVRLSRKAYSYLRFVINFVNPVFYIKLLLSNTIFRFGKKSMYLIVLDYIGNNTYHIYHKESEVTCEEE